mgnify:CR=1 FL=1
MSTFKSAIIAAVSNAKTLDQINQMDTNKVLEAISDDDTKSLATELLVEPIRLDREISEKYIVSVFARLREVAITRTIVEIKSKLQRLNPVENPDEYQAIFTELFGRGDAYEYLKQKNVVDFISTSFVRGITINDSIIVVDEIANMTLHELDSVITRVGKNCRIIFSGDFRQTDFTREHEKNGLVDFMRILNKMKSFEYIDFTEQDIVRSAMVKEYIIAKDRLKIVA